MDPGGVGVRDVSSETFGVSLKVQVNLLETSRLTGGLSPSRDRDPRTFGPTRGPGGPPL